MKTVSELTFPNIWVLRELCKEQLAEHPLEEMKAAEWEHCASLMQDEMRKRFEIDPERAKESTNWESYFPWAYRITSDVSPNTGTAIPKWSAFITWLSEDGICLQVPMLVAAIINHHIPSHVDTDG